MAKVFSKEKWLESANADKAADIFTQCEIDDAIAIWADAFDGKSKDEIKENFLNDDWFVEKN